MDKIVVKGARTHNLKNINLEIPKDKLIVITGLSGSGKSSLAFDTIYAEGQRRYVESLSAYARQFLGLMDKPDVDLIEGLSPAISIDQKTSGHNPRSTVGTVTEIYDYLRLLFARVGHPRSPVTGRKLEKQTVSQIVDRILALPKILAEEKVKLMVLAPIIKSRKGTYEELFARMLKEGFVRARVDGQVYSLEEEIKLDKYVKHDIEIVIDRLVVDASSKDDESFVKRLTDSIELSLNFSSGEMYVNLLDIKDKEFNEVKIRSNGDIFFSENLVDPETGESFPEIEPHSFSFNSPHGACEKCSGLGVIKEFAPAKLFNQNLTISEGGIYPLHRIVENLESYMMASLSAMAQGEGFSLKTPLGELNEKQIDILMNGSGSKKYTFQYVNFMGQNRSVNRGFEGLVPWLQKKYDETDSEWVRSDVEQYMIDRDCPVCMGLRLKRESLSVSILGKNISDVSSLTIEDAIIWINQFYKNDIWQQDIDFSKISEIENYDSSMQRLFDFKKIDAHSDELTDQEKQIGKQIFKEISDRLGFLVAVGLNYLTLNRTAKTLSGGESQRIRLASQIGTGLTGVLYVLDEPSIGLHQRDNDRLLKTLERLRDIGNTVLVVEHDEDTILKADHIVDIGPLAGVHGGEIIFSGLPAKLIENPENSLTGQYLAGKKKINKEELLKEMKNIEVIDAIDPKSMYKSDDKIIVQGIKHNNLKNIDLKIPLGKFICITGVSGSGKSSMINDVLVAKIARDLNNRKVDPGEFDSIEGLEKIDKLVEIDQSPIGRTPRSNPATYTGIFTEIRRIFSLTTEAKTRGYKPGRFSFNVKGGRCEKCEGAGVIQISMQFLPDVYVKCDECKGNRYNRETLQVDYKGKNIAEVLDMTVEDGLTYFENINLIKTKLQTLNDVGLGYIKLGQAATTLSGGESQRVKLATELSKRQTGKTFYVLDEPTTGLHFEDVKRLLVVLHGLVLKGNTVLVIEHNLDVIKTADWIVDLGPEGGDKGGEIIAEGTPAEVAKNPKSYTGQWLKKLRN